MNEWAAGVLVLSERISVDDLRRIVEGTFRDMAKYVVDVEKGWIAIGGELHSDAEQRLLELGSDPEVLWGANYRPGRGRAECIDFTSLINIRPARGNPGMEVMDPGIRDRIRTLTYELIGEGEPL